jgi:hypothetical protein
MGFIFYEYIGLIKSGSDTSLEALEQELRKEYANSKKPVSIKREIDSITVTIDNYKFRVYFSDGSHVGEESKEMAGVFAIDAGGNPVNKADIENCTRRFEMAGDDDANMDYFNDSLYVIDSMERLGVIVLDPHNPS